MDRASTF